MFGNYDTSDLRFEQAELDAALATVKRRVQRRRGIILLPAVVAVGVGAAAYFAVLDPTTGARVAVVDYDTDTNAGSNDSEQRSDTEEVAEIADSSGPDAPGAGDHSDTGDAADRGSTALASQDQTASSPLGEGDAGGVPSGTAEPTRPTSPAISFDASNVIRRESPESASTSTPPTLDAVSIGTSFAEGSEGIDNRRTEDVFGTPEGVNGSDAEVGASSEADVLEGSLDASPESSSTGNPSAGLEGSGEGANPTISFEDTGEEPQISTISSETSASQGTSAGDASLNGSSPADTSGAAGDVNSQDDVAAAVGRQSDRPGSAKVEGYSFESDGLSVTLTAQVTVQDGNAHPCGITVDWGDGVVHSLPCETDCSVPVPLQAAQELQFTHTYAEAGKAEIVVGTADALCVTDPALDLGLPLYPA